MLPWWLLLFAVTLIITISNKAHFLHIAETVSSMWHCWAGLFLWTHLNWTDQRKDMAPWPAVIPPVTSPVMFLSIPGTTGSQEQTSSHAVPLPAVHSPCHYSWPAPVYSFSLRLAVTFSSKSSLSFSSWVGCHTSPTPQFSRAFHLPHYSIMTT